MRRARPEDVDELLDGYAAVAGERVYIAGEPPIDRDRRRAAWLETIDPSTPGTSFVAEAGAASAGPPNKAGGRLVGHLGITGTGRMDLGMWVAEDWRGKGVGTALVEAAIAYAREDGAYKISLEVWPHNAAAIALYEKFGFEREGYLRKHWRRRNGELWDSVVMGLLLDE